MTRVNLDALPEAVRQFVLTLAVPPDGTVLELGGRPVAYVVPPPQTNSGAIDDEKWTDARNRRRCELIDRKYDTSLTATEEAELTSLQTAMDRHVDRVAPLPLEAARKLHQQLLEKATKTAAGSDA